MVCLVKHVVGARGLPRVDDGLELGDDDGTLGELSEGAQFVAKERWAEDNIVRIPNPTEVAERDSPCLPVAQPLPRLLFLRHLVFVTVEIAIGPPWSVVMDGLLPIDIFCFYR